MDLYPCPMVNGRQVGVEIAMGRKSEKQRAKRSKRNLAEKRKARLTREKRAKLLRKKRKEQNSTSRMREEKFPMPPEEEEFEEFMRMMALPLNMPKLKSNYSSVFDRLESFNREDALAKIGALLCDLSLQSNCIRLEALAHIAMLACDGSDQVGDDDVRKSFVELGDGICGRNEDPGEDVFVSLVHTNQCNFRVLEGIWESGTFYLQRILDVIETFPEGPNFNKLRERVHALLILSDAVCHRAELQEYQSGQPYPLQDLDDQHTQFMNSGCVVFTREELQDLGLEIDQFDLFTFTSDLKETFAKQELHDSMLRRYPVLVFEDKLVLGLPTAVSSAIRMAVCNQLLLNRYRPTLAAQLENSYHHLWDRSGLLGLVNRPVSFYAEHGGTPHLEFSSIDQSGANVHFYFLLDDFSDLSLSVLNSPRMLSDEDNERILSSITSAREFAKERDEFSRGITLVVFCGIGRGVGIDRRSMAEHEDWNVEFLSAADFDVLNHRFEFTPVDLFRLIDWRLKVENLGLDLQNNNGLLNLLAFQQSEDGKVVNSNDLDPGVRENGGGLVIGCNFVAEFRQDYWRTTDYRLLPTPTETSCLMRRIGGNRTSALGDVAVYAMPVRRNQHGIPIAVKLLSSNRVWWGRTLAEEGHNISYWTRNGDRSIYRFGPTRKSLVPRPRF